MLASILLMLEVPGAVCSGVGDEYCWTLLVGASISLAAHRVSAFQASYISVFAELNIYQTDAYMYVFRKPFKEKLLKEKTYGMVTRKWQHFVH